MHCSSCARIIEQSLKKVPGVKQANVNFAAEKAVVIYDESQVQTNELIKVVISAGYKAELVDAKNPEHDRQKHPARDAAYQAADVLQARPPADRAAHGLLAGEEPA